MGRGFSGLPGSRVNAPLNKYPLSGIKIKKESPVSIYKKLVEIQDKLPTVKKNGFNSFHKYTYVTEADILAAVGPLLAKAGIAHFVSVEDCQVNGPSATVKVKLTLVCSSLDTIDDSCLMEVVTYSYGHAIDAKGDKAVYKAITGATKYAYLKAFGMSTSDDPENETVEESEAKANKGKYQPKPATPTVRDTILNEIGSLFSEHGFTRETFAEVPAIQAPEEASDEELADALEVVRKRAALNAELRGVA